MTPRTLRSTLLLAAMLFAPSIASAQVATLTPITAPAPATVQDEPGSDEEVEGSDDSGGEEEFCGDDGDPGMERVWEIEDELSEGHVGEANRDVVHGFRQHVFTGGSRFPAFMLLAETRLRLGHYARALGTYRHAFGLGHPVAEDASHVGMAVALMRAGRRAEARTEAASFVAAACGDRPTDPVACYGARMVIATTVDDAAERATQQHGAQALRRSEPEQESSFARISSLFPEAPAVLVASR